MEQRITLIQLIPFVLILPRLIAKWLNFDKLGIVILSGFIVYALLRLIDSLQTKYKEFGLGILKITVPVIIILLAFDSLWSGQANFAALASALLFESFLIKKASI